jgi:hypothetical protein
MFSLFNSFYNHPWLWTFSIVFCFRYARAVANYVAYSTYKPISIPEKPSYQPPDVSVIIPTTDINTPTFHKVVDSILAHPISALIIATAGPTATEHERRLFEAAFPDGRIEVLWREVPNRREQTAMAVDLITAPGTVTPLMTISDDHTFWPTQSTFVPSLIASFEDAKIGAVGPVLEARHHHHPVSFRGFWNFMGMTYLLRRAHEFLATNTIDGGLSCLSSRFAVFRTCIYGSPEFKKAYLNEYVFGGRVGPLNADDDKFHTRWLVNNGPESVMTTELGEWPKFIGQCVRWNRTTWRSNPRALFTERTAWRRHPYTTYAILLYSFVRMSLFYEITLAWLLDKALVESGLGSWSSVGFWTLMLWCTEMKFEKVFPQFKKHPADLIYFPGYLVFAWYVSFIKVWAFFTCWDDFWATAATKKTPTEDITPILEGVLVGRGGVITPNSDLSDNEGGVKKE